MKTIAHLNKTKIIICIFIISYNIVIDQMLPQLNIEQIKISKIRSSIMNKMIQPNLISLTILSILCDLYIITLKTPLPALALTEQWRSITSHSLYCLLVCLLTGQRCNQRAAHSLQIMFFIVSSSSNTNNSICFQLTFLRHPRLSTDIHGISSWSSQ